MTFTDGTLDSTRSDLGANIRRLRLSLNLTQEQFANRLSVTPLTIIRWESGQSNPRKLALDRLRELEEAEHSANARTPLPKLARLSAPPALDFAGNPDAISAVAEAYRLIYGHQFNPAFASEISRIDPLPHQRIAVYDHMLPQHPLRFLLADDAGAGKTIMTGLYVREMLLRGRIRRVLVVPPAGLVGNWERELRTLFRLNFRIVSGKDIRGDNPFASPHGDFAIISIDTLAGESAFAMVGDAATPPYDLVVFDEAHKLSAVTRNFRTDRTDRYRLAEGLFGCAAASSRFSGLRWQARHRLLLTATPHMGNESAYHNLWRLLDPDLFSTGEACRRFPQEERHRHFIRRTKEEMVDIEGSPIFRERTCDTLSFDLNAGEQALYEATTRYLLSTYGRALHNRGAARLALGVFQRRLASSTLALLRSFDRRIGKLDELAQRLRRGDMSWSELEGLQSKLNHKYRQDFFDSHSAEEDSGEAGEKYEIAVLGAFAAVTIEELLEEIATLKTLREQARRVLEASNESKFEKLREVLEDSRYAQEKWLIFTEHRDTMNFLVGRLEGLGYSGKVAQIHGGMAWREREAQMEQFRRTAGARYLVATDAAGEGINLQFCSLMVNYDIPWNPARLEQRMGRIHRYKQRRNVRIVNFVSRSTHEGRVLEVLLNKLDAIREELRSDKVFDVIGQLFENKSLREYMIEALTDEGEQRVRDQVGDVLKHEKVLEIKAGEQGVYGPSGEVAEQLDGLQDDMERERYLQLLPGYVRRFVEKSAPLLNLEIRGDLGGFFSLAPQSSGALDSLLPALEKYPAAARERLRTSRFSDANCIWLHPGEPVFDALLEQVRTRFASDALRGGIFVDPKADAPYAFHLALISVEQESGYSASADLSDSEPPPVRPITLERRLLALQQSEDELRDCSVEHFLLLHSAPEVPPGAVPLAGRGVAMRAEAATFGRERIAEELTEEHRKALEVSQPEQSRRLRIAFDLRAAELARQRAKLSDKKTSDIALERQVGEMRRRQSELNGQRDRLLRELQYAGTRIKPGDFRFIAHALAVPASDPGEAERYDERVEEIAVGIALAWEKERNATVQDVSKPQLARLAGLPDWPGFDLLSTSSDGAARCIEVKGRAGRTGIQMEANEWKQACHLGERYWLYAVFGCATSSPELVRVCDPFTKLLTHQRSMTAYTISASDLLAAAEPA